MVQQQESTDWVIVRQGLSIAAAVVTIAWLSFGLSKTKGSDTFSVRARRLSLSLLLVVLVLVGQITLLTQKLSPCIYNMVQIIIWVCLVTFGVIAISFYIVVAKHALVDRILFLLSFVILILLHAFAFTNSQQGQVEKQRQQGEQEQVQLMPMSQA